MHVMKFFIRYSFIILQILLSYQHLCVCVCVCVYIYTHTRARTHAHPHTHIHTHTHTYIQCRCGQSILIPYPRYFIRYMLFNMKTPNLIPCKEVKCRTLIWTQVFNDGLLGLGVRHPNVFILLPHYPWMFIKL